MNPTKRIFTWAITLALLYAITSCGSNKKNSIEQKSATNITDVLPIEAHIVKPAQLNTSIEAPGTLLPFEETAIKPEVSGKLRGLYIKEGSYVHKGSLLAKLFDEDLQAQLKKLQVQLKIAEKTVERQQELLSISGISQQEVDLSRLQASNLQADIALLRVNISKTIITAPFSGTIGLKNISNGAYITPATVISTIRQLSPLKLAFTIPEMYSSTIRVGEKISFTLSNHTTHYEATVIATEAAMEENTRSLAVRALVNTKNKELVAGSFATVNIEVSNNNNAILIPTQAIVPQGRKKQVFLVKTGKAIATDITTGTRDSSKIEVLSGLQYGDTVITSGLLFVKPGIDIIPTIVN
jgi:membrane fusion protein, multidrug efflux system